MLLRSLSTALSLLALVLATATNAAPSPAEAAGQVSGAGPHHGGWKPPSSDLHIRTKYGPVIGHAIQKPEGEIREFLGIPYGYSPTGALRFQPPLSPRPWHLPLNATRFGPSCIQVAYSSPIFGSNGGGSSGSSSNITLPPPLSESEDCLSINIWAPRSSSSSSAVSRGGLPVLLWTYGGGFMVGSSDTPIYNGANWVARQAAAGSPVLVVSFNYRLNAFGFPGAPGLKTQNVGLWDVRKAVEWVTENIGAFGGDPERVTLFGESAGGGAVDAYLYTHRHDPKISGAIMQSGSIEIIWERERSGLLDPRKNWDALVAAVNCTGRSGGSLTTPSAPTKSGRMVEQIQLACMRRVPWEALRRAISRQSLVFGPSIDNQTLHADLLGRLSAGKFANIPVLIGSNDQETLGDSPEAIKRTKESFTCPAARGARGHAKKHPTWLYRYFGNFTTRAGVPPIGPYHGAEIIQVFGNFPQTPDETQKKSSEYLQGAWTAFARDPKRGLKKLGWPTFKDGAESLVVLAKDNAIEATFEDPAPYIEGC